MRTEGAVFPPEAENGQQLLDLLVDLFNLAPALFDPDPDYVHVVEIWEDACSLDLRCEQGKMSCCREDLTSLSRGVGTFPRNFNVRWTVLAFDRFKSPPRD